MLADTLYALVRPLLFLLPAESAHHFSLLLLKYWAWFWPQARAGHLVHNARTVMGCRFRNPVGLAAGLDKDAKYLSGLLSLGFGHIEVGTVTLRPQRGNPAPRLFRKVSKESLLNCMGFNNLGATHLCERIATSRIQKLLSIYDTRLGISIGINSDTLKKNALSELTKVFKQVYRYADYIAINFSSPNTAGLRDYQNREDLANILAGLNTVRATLHDVKRSVVPLVVKLTADQDESTLLSLVPTIKQYAEGVIFSNTMAHRETMRPYCYWGKQLVISGGLSGRLLQKHMVQKTAILASALSPLPLIACGGIDSGVQARGRIIAGAQLVQLYTGLVYKGPHLPQKIADYLQQIDA